MKYIVFPSFLLISLCSCNPRVYRVNYTTQSKDYWDCGVPVKKKMTIADTLVKIGDIKLGDCGSKKYNEEQSFAVLRNEGCALDAEVVNITKENDKAEWNTCYQCEAEFYVKKKTDGPTYQPLNKKKTAIEKWQVALYVISGVALVTVFVLLHS